MTRAEQDLATLAERLCDSPRGAPRLAGFFPLEAEIVLARAPGRLDVMGGIADYSGSLVLELPLAEATCCAASLADDGWVRVLSLRPLPREARFPASELWRASESFAAARAYFAQQPLDQSWASYVVGGLVALRSRGVSALPGLRLLIDSSVPEGRGVSSSAALEVAALRALSELFARPFSGLELGLECQRVENRVVGAPCGVMDPMTSACGREDQLLALLCQPAELRGFVGLPEGVSVYGIDSGVTHAVSGAPYREVRVAAFMGLRLLAERLGAEVRPHGPGRVRLERDPLGGYLANLRPATPGAELLSALPESMSGAEFLAKWGGISDEVTEVEEGCEYRIRAATLHPVDEHVRVQAWARALPGATTSADLAHLGQLMFDSHASYSACGLGSDGTDQLVEAVRAAGPGAGLFGAKITGGGSGGTVAVLALTERLDRLEQIARDYAAKSGRSARIFAGSSPGAVGVPVQRLRLPRSGLPSG